MKSYKYIAIVFVLVLSLSISAACAKDEPSAAPEAIPEDMPAVVDDTPAPPPEPEAVPGRVLPASWSESEFFIFDSGLIVDVSADWIPRPDGEATVYYFSDDSELPRLSLYSDYVFDIDDFDEFFDWWLAERFYNPEYNAGAEVIREEYVTYNGIRGLEIDYLESSDGTLRHAFYTFFDRHYYQIRFAFEPNGDSSYMDDIAFVFNSIRLNQTEIDAWPTAYLPAGTPVYTDGGPIEGNAFTWYDYGSIDVHVSNTSADALSDFADQMEKLGWALDYSDIANGGSAGGSKGIWSAHMYMGEDGTTAFLGFNFNLN